MCNMSAAILSRIPLSHQDFGVSETALLRVIDKDTADLAGNAD